MPGSKQIAVNVYLRTLFPVFCYNGVITALFCLHVGIHRIKFWQRDLWCQGLWQGRFHRLLPVGHIGLFPASNVHALRENSLHFDWRLFRCGQRSGSTGQGVWGS